MEDALNVFVDEFGNSPLSVETDGTSAYFILVAVTIKETECAQVKSELEELQKKYFKGVPLESKRVRNDHERRTKVLNDLFNISGFKYHVLIVDKKRLDRAGGFAYKGSFYKYFNRKLYEHLVGNSIKTSFFADQYGTKEYMVQLRDYIHKRISEGLLFSLSSTPTITFSRCEEDSLLSLPDFIAGTWGKILEGDASTEVKAYWRKTLMSKLLWIQSWPHSIEDSFSVPESSGQYDPLIYRLSLSKAYAFINSNTDSLDEDIKMQLDVVEFLLYRQVYGEKDDYVHADSIVNHLKDIGYPDVDNDKLRYDVIAPLRNSGIFISSSRKGYKISLSEQDILDFFDFSQSYILPLLDRVTKVSDSVATASNGEVDLLASFAELKRIVKTAPPH